MISKQENNDFFLYTDGDPDHSQLNGSYVRQRPIFCITKVDPSRSIS